MILVDNSFSWFLGNKGNQARIPWHPQPSHKVSTKCSFLRSRWKDGLAHTFSTPEASTTGADHWGTWWVEPAPPSEFRPESSLIMWRGKFARFLPSCSSVSWPPPPPPPDVSMSRLVVCWATVAPGGSLCRNTERFFECHVKSVKNCRDHASAWSVWDISGKKIEILENWCQISHSFCLELSILFFTTPEPNKNYTRLYWRSKSWRQVLIKLKLIFPYETSGMLQTYLNFPTGNKLRWGRPILGFFRM